MNTIEPLGIFLLGLWFLFFFARGLVRAWVAIGIFFEGGRIDPIEINRRQPKWNRILGLLGLLSLLGGAVLILIARTLVK